MASIEHGHIKANPFVSVKLAAAPVRERFLTIEEAKALIAAIDATMTPPFAEATKLLLFTGARKTEILGLRWTEIDFERRQLRLPPERTKAGGKTGERHIVLPPPATAILRSRATARMKASRKELSEFVFPGSRGVSHLTGLRRPFIRACAAAGLSDVRIHDLRHSFASLAVANGASLFLVGKLLGHASTRTTERYAHLSSDPLHEAADLVAGTLVHGEHDHV
ncbi:MAG: site-specific integrase [Pseudomonadota bacterium]